MKVYTKTGDAGETSLLGGKRVGKCCIEMKVIGEIDELNAALGLAIASLSVIPAKAGIQSANFLQNIQRDLFKVGSELASLQAEVKCEKISAEKVSELERKIDELWPQMPDLKNFILPGGCEAACRLHMARAICRRAERELVAFSKNAAIRTELLQYLNRLSDFLFTAARWANHQTKTKEETV